MALTRSSARKKMTRIATLANRMWSLSAELGEELSDIGCDVTYLRDGSGCGLEDLESGDLSAIEPILDRIFVEKDIRP